TRDRLADELKALSEQIRTLKNDIDLAGGQRLRDIPGLIREEKTARDTKDQASQRYHLQLSKCRIHERVETAESFLAMRHRLHSALEATRQRLETLGTEHEEQLAQRAICNRQIQDEQAELQILSQRQTNLTSHFTSMRSRICED